MVHPPAPVLLGLPGRHLPSVYRRGDGPGEGHGPADLRQGLSRTFVPLRRSPSDLEPSSCQEDDLCRSTLRDDAVVRPCLVLHDYISSFMDASEERFKLASSHGISPVASLAGQ